MTPEFAPWRELGGGRIARDPQQGHGPRPRRRIAGGVDHPTIADVERAAARIAAHVIRTPVATLGIDGLDGLAKLEACQLSGSCKRRGAANRLLTLSPEERAAGVVTASSGNHARAVAELAAELGTDATVCVPRWTDAVKLDAIRARGATIRDDQDSYDAAARLARRLAVERHLSLVPAFDDPDVIAGQGTLGLELCEQAADLDAILVPLSGGGLCSGVALAVRQRSPQTRLIGVSAANASVLYHCLLAGRLIQVDERPTIASALSGGLGDHNDHSLAIVAELLDEAWLVDEREIARAILWGTERLGLVIEGGAAVALAPLLRADAATLLCAAATEGTRRPPRVAAVLSGGNIDDQMLARARALAV